MSMVRDKSRFSFSYAETLLCHVRELLLSDYISNVRLFKTDVGTASLMSIQLWFKH